MAREVSREVGRGGWKHMTKTNWRPARILLRLIWDLEMHATQNESLSGAESIAQPGVVVRTCPLCFRILFVVPNVYIFVFQPI